MKKALLLLCIFYASVTGSSAQTLKIDTGTSILLPSSCDSGYRAPLTFKITYKGPSIFSLENIGVKYFLNGTTYKINDSIQVDSLFDGDSITVEDSLIINVPNGFTIGTEDIVVIWPTGSGGIAISGDSILDSTYVNQVAGISLNNTSFNISLFPNPTENWLYLNYDANAIHLEQVRIYNLLGQTLLQKSAAFNSIDIHLLPDDIYYFEAMTTQKNKYIARFVKTH